MSESKLESIKGVITLDDGSTSEFLIETGNWSWHQWNAEGWFDPKARLGKAVPILDAMLNGLVTDYMGMEGDE